MKYRSYVIVLLLVGSFWYVPAQVQAQTLAVESTDRAVLLEIIEVLQQEIRLLQKQLQYQLIWTDSTLLVGKTHTAFEDSHNVLAKYSATNRSDVLEIANLSHRQYFLRVLDVIPVEYSEIIAEFVVFDGDNVMYDAHVETIAPLHKMWQYAIHVDMLIRPNSAANTELIIHELAHLISYEEMVGVPKPATQHCAEYFDALGCPAGNSYLNQFVRSFWSAADLERAQRFARNDNSDEVSRYYRLNQAQYVTDYAASSPEEDFAESFVYFILDIPVRGDVAQDKVAFFAQHPGLLDSKADILQSI